MATSTIVAPSWVTELASPPAHKQKHSSIPDPPGYSSASSGSSSKKKQAAATTREPPSQEEMDTLKLKKAWEVALAPIKSLPMTAIMMYMSGNSLQIFSIMMVFMAFKNPIMGILSTNTAFERFESKTNRQKVLQVKVVYVAMQLVALAMGLWKINGMGLLPTTRSDWLAWEVAREVRESAVVGV